MNYAIYLRKSRADLQYDNIEDVLEKHEKTLTELAQRLGYNIIEIYKEVVSGDTIAARPQMQRLLADVEQGIYDGVLVMEVERLARGDTIDQGIVAQTFKYSNTKIITPIKTYDPSNEYDEEYFEFGLFMSRREFKTIKRRLNAGRLRSVKDGNYIGSIAPYGYDKAVINKHHTLTINDTEAENVKLIYELYTNGNSKNNVARILNSAGIKPRNNSQWTSNTIKYILSNPVYIGKVKWDTRKQIKNIVNGKVQISRPRNHDGLTYQGIHEPIIDLDMWNRAQEFNKQQEVRVSWNSASLQNPLAKLIICEKCGKIMQRRPYKKRGQAPTLICTNTECDNVSSPLYMVEEKVLDTLKEIYKNYKYENKTTQKVVSMKSQYEKQLEKEKNKLSRIYSAYEDELYSKSEFAERKKVVEDKIKELEKLLEEDTQKITKKEMLHRLSKLLELYDKATIQEKNDLLRSVVEKIIYRKDKKCLRKKDDPYNFELTFYLKYQG